MSLQDEIDELCRNYSPMQIFDALRETFLKMSQQVQTEDSKAKRIRTANDCERIARRHTERRRTGA